MRILPDAITIGSFPGPDRSIRDQDMRALRFLSRRYRNRRLGEFLKELEMTEGRGTGIPKILREIKKNRSPEPIFHTDDDRSFSLVEFPLHLAFAEGMKREEATEVTTEVTTEVKRLLLVASRDHSCKELQELLGLKTAEHFRKSYLLPAINAGFVGMTLPGKPTSRLQKYRLTKTGQSLQKWLTAVGAFGLDIPLTCLDIFYRELGTNTGLLCLGMYIDRGKISVSRLMRRS